MLAIPEMARVSGKTGVTGVSSLFEKVFVFPNTYALGESYTFSAVV